MTFKTQRSSTKSSRPAIIVLVCWLFSSCPGCQVLGIPSYRSHPGMAGGQARCPSDACLTGDGASYSVEASEYDSNGDEYRVGLLPPIPVPMWFANWRAKRELEKALPVAPEYPRFHPLPTRPMFAPQPGAGGQNYAPAADPQAHILGPEANQLMTSPQMPYEYGRMPSPTETLPQMQYSQEMTPQSGESMAESIELPQPK